MIDDKNYAEKYFQVAANFSKEKEIKEKEDEKLEKPPIGITPGNIFYQEINYQRANEIISGMKRFSNSGTIIPIEWICEIEDIIEIMSNY